MSRENPWGCVSARETVSSVEDERPSKEEGFMKAADDLATMVVGERFNRIVFYDVSRMYRRRRSIRDPSGPFPLSSTTVAISMSEQLRKKKEK